MSVNLLEMFKDQVGGQLVSQASSMLGESQSGIQSALGALLPGLMGSIIDKGSTAQGAAGILDFMKDNKVDGSLLGNLGGLFSGGSSTDRLMGTGSTILKFFMGDRVGALVDFVTNMAGIKSGAVSGVLRMAAPMLLGLISKQVSKGGLNASGLMNLLLGQRDNTRRLAPAGLGDVLGFSAFSDPKSTRTTTTTTHRATPEPDNGGGMGKLLPWLIGLLAILGAMYLFGETCSGTKMGDAAKDAVDKVGEVTEDAAAAVGDAAGAVGDAVGDAAGAVKDAIMSIRLPDGSEIKAKANSFTYRFSEFLKDKTADIKTSYYAFDGVHFETGSARLTSASTGQLQELASVLKAYPNVHIEIGGHTDSTGDPAKNRTLSQQRALAVSNALQGMGVSASRLSAKGYGSTRPAATNATSGGKAENRRVEVRVTKR